MSPAVQLPSRGGGAQECWPPVHRAPGKKGEVPGGSKTAVPCPPQPHSILRPSTPPSKPVAFEDFKNERGSEINRIFKENKSILNERRKRASEITQRINAIKQEIDVTKAALDFQKSLREKQGRCDGTVAGACRMEVVLLRMRPCWALEDGDRRVHLEC